MITSIDQLDPNGVYSYADYLTWRFEERLELIKGKIFRMSPAPNLSHQGVSRNLTIMLGSQFWDKECRLYVAPCDVRLLDKRKSTKDKDILTVVQPDVYVVCDLSKLQGKSCLGAPDLVVEILSPYNKKHDLVVKKALYEENGVREYWIVFPTEQVLEIYNLNEQGKFELFAVHGDEGEEVQSFIFKDVKINFLDIFRP